MTILQAVLLGLVSGVTGVFPVSSSGHVVMLGTFLGISGVGDLHFLSLLHIGILAAVVSCFYQDLMRLVTELFRMLMDVLYNCRIYLMNKKIEETIPYQKIVSNYYRRFALFILISMMPATVIAACISRFVQAKGSHLLSIAMGFLVTSVMLLVSSFIPKTEKGPKEAKMMDAFLMGCFQGFTPIPGVSRLGVSVASGYLNGFTGKFTVKYSYILAVPMILGSLIFERGGGLSSTTVGAGCCVAGVIACGITACITIRIGKRMLSQKNIRFISAYCIVTAVASMAGYLI